MTDLKALQDLAYRTADTGIPDIVKEKYDQGLASIGKKLWSGWLQVASSGFGKGLLLTAAAITVAIMASNGVTAVAAGAALEQGLSQGLEKAVNFFMSSWHATTLLIAGGVLGSVAEAVGNRNRKTAEAAREEARMLEYARNRGRSRQPETQVAPGTPAQPHPSAEPSVRNTSPESGVSCLQAGNSFEHCAREAKRRADSANRDFGVSP